MQEAGRCVAVGLEYGCLGVGTPGLPMLEYALKSMLRLLSQHHAIGLQTDCMVTVLAPWLRLLDSHAYVI